jgi:hypothetical protein
VALPDDDPAGTVWLRVVREERPVVRLSEEPLQDDDLDGGVGV